MTRKIRIGLVYGGKSGEHDISLQTALAVSKAIDHNKFEVVPFYITTKGEWRSGTPLTGPMESKQMLQFDSSEQELALQPIFTKRELEGTSDTAEGQGIDVVFPLLHGTYGEDGTIQGLLEMADIPYVGAGVMASAVGMDKVMMKKIFKQEGLPQCKYHHFVKKRWEKEAPTVMDEIEHVLGYPCFVKPANLGSSVGISKVKNREALQAAVQGALLFDRKVIVEEMVDAREIEVGVLGNDDPKASVPGEIVASGDFYDYKAKYVDGKSMMIIPAEISETTIHHLQEMAVRAFQTIEATGLSRVDFFIRKSDNQIFINEINTMPGFTPFSMYPLLWKESGKSYVELLDELIMLAMERFQEKKQLQYTFDIE